MNILDEWRIDMGREIRRVPLDFDWPLNMPWKGFMSPYTAQDCTVCDHSGYNPATKQISDDWYDFAGTGREWHHNITQVEVDALIESGRLMDFTHTWTRGEGWQPRDPMPVITAEMVNEWSRHGMGHDAINRSICVRARAEHLGVWGWCPVCDGEGSIWFNDNVKQLSDAWYENERYGPPEGDGWQVWETVSEGSPISPVFATSEEMVEWLIGEGYSEEASRKFIDVQWVPSGMSKGGVVKRNIEGLTL